MKPVQWAFDQDLVFVTAWYKNDATARLVAPTAGNRAQPEEIYGKEKVSSVRCRQLVAKLGLVFGAIDLAHDG